MKQVNPYKLEITDRNRKAIRRQDYSWLQSHYSLGCYHGVWDEGYNFEKTRRHEILVTTDRKNGCFFWEYTPGMLFPGAEKLQQRQMKAVQVLKESELIKILFLAANPSDTIQLRLDEEVRAIDERLRRSEFRDSFELKQHWAVRVSDIQEYLLRHQPHIVHFSGHGSKTGEIILQNDSGASHPISVGALSNLFSTLKDNIRCVVLNACYSEQQAQATAQHIDCVVGMSRAITDSSAISFATSFYQALGYGRSVKTAFDLGCGQVDMEGLNEQDTPRLLALNNDPSEIFFISGIVKKKERISNLAQNAADQFKEYCRSRDIENIEQCFKSWLYDKGRDVIINYDIFEETVDILQKDGLPVEYLLEEEYNQLAKTMKPIG